MIIAGILPDKISANFKCSHHCVVEMPSKKEILIVEDTKTQMLILEGLLVDSGFDVETASDGESALAYCREGEARVVLTDINMPGMNGYELCKKIKADPKMKAAFPVILLESLSDSRSLVDILASGADAFIYKQFEDEYFIPLLNSLLDGLELDNSDCVDLQLNFEGQLLTCTSRQLQFLLQGSFRTAVYWVNKLDG